VPRSDCTVLVRSTVRRGSNCTALSQIPRYVALFCYIRELPLRGYLPVLIPFDAPTDTVPRAWQDYPRSYLLSIWLIYDPCFPGPIVMPLEGADLAQATLPTRVLMQGNDIQSTTPTQRHLIYSVQAIEIDLMASPDTSPEQIRALIADDISPGLLFDVEVAHLSPIYRHRRDWLRGLGIPMEVQASRRIPFQLADTLYRETADAEAARELSRAIVTGRRGGGAGNVSGTGGRHDPAGAAATAATIAQAAQGERAAHNMGMRFRGDAAKFLGTPDEALHEYVAEDQQVAHDYKLSAEQQLLFWHNLFGGKAKRFFDAHVYENVHLL